jgi:hypothetical protein
MLAVTGLFNQYSNYTNVTMFAMSTGVTSRPTVSINLKLIEIGDYV